MKKELLEKLLYKSFDGVLSEEERHLLETGLKESEELQLKHKEIQKLRSAVKESVQLSFDPSFDDSLYMKINKVQSEYSSGWMDGLAISFRQVAYTAAFILTLLVIYNLNNGNDTSIANIFGLYQTPLEYAIDPGYHLLWSGI